MTTAFPEPRRLLCLRSKRSPIDFDTREGTDSGAFVVCSSATESRFSDAIAGPFS
jgi:hypothetical protein